MIHNLITTTKKEFDSIATFRGTGADHDEGSGGAQGRRLLAELLLQYKINNLNSLLNMATLKNTEITCVYKD